MRDLVPHPMGAERPPAQRVMETPAVAVVTLAELERAVARAVEPLRRELLEALRASAGEQLLTPAEAAEYRKVSVRHVQRLMTSGQLPAYGRGRVRRVRRADVDRVLGELSG